jgi:hypothetical protein
MGGVMICVFFVGGLVYWGFRDSSNENSKQKHYTEIVGIYQLDLQKTKLGAYADDSNLSNVTIIFKSDSTFILSKSLPFIYDTIGSWGVSGNKLDEMNYICFAKPSVIGRVLKEQFSQVFGSDSMFVFNSMTPQIGKNPIQEIYFKKQKGR